MFSNATNTSKYCLLFLISILNKHKFSILDSQFYNAHLIQFGAYEILDEEYYRKLKIALKKKNNFPIEFSYFESLSILQSLAETS